MSKFDYLQALKRLVQRCPQAAGEDPHVQELLQKQDANSDQDYLRVLPLLLTRPGVTLAAATMFRPSLLRVVASLVDDCYSQQVAPSAPIAVALIYLLAVAPHLEREVLRYFKQFPGPHHYLLQEDAGTRMAGSGLQLEELAYATLSGLQTCGGLRQCWKWPHLIGMLTSSENINTQWCGLLCMEASLGIKKSDAAALMAQTLSVEQDAACALGWQNHCAAIAAEKAAMLCTQGMRPGQGETTPSSSSDGDQYVDSSPIKRKRKFAELSNAAPAAGYAEVCGLELPLRKPAGGSGLAYRVVMTQAFERSIEGFALGLCTGAPILIEGPPGSGKSSMIQHVADLTGNADELIAIHLDDQMDSKALFGAYVCASKPGEFVWQPGPLTQAMTKGCWVLIEDINLAPAEVLATLVPILEQRAAFIPSRAEMIHAAPGFQLIATITVDPDGSNAGVYGSSQTVRDLLGGLFHYVRVEPPAPAEQLAILEDNFPALAPLLSHAMQSLLFITAAFGQVPTQFVSDEVHAALSAAGMTYGAMRINRHFSFRDVMKWARRMASFHGTLLSRTLKAADMSQCRNNVGAIPLAAREAAFTEYADCCCSLLSSPDAHYQLLTGLAAVWGVPSPTVDQYARLAKPDLQISVADVVVGRVTLARKQNVVDSQKGGSRFATTGHAMRLMERVAAAAAQNESLLLVGETGTGKTTLVQQLAQRVGAKLVVLNLSQQTDSSDLIGGFRPVQPADAVLALLDTFVALVRRTWQRGNNEEYIGRIVKLAAQRKWASVLKAFKQAIDKVLQGQQVGSSAGEKATKAGKKKRTEPSVQCLDDWGAFANEVATAEATATAAEGGFAFNFTEGALVRAVREGSWLLLDEVNLAPAEALERIAELLGGDNGSITIVERGDVSSIHRHPDFRLFSAMNPATDAGKRDLPAPIRNRFTEIWVGEPVNRDDLAAIVAGYLLAASAAAPVDSVVDFYLAAKAEAEATLQDGAGHKPTYNLRTLSRALEYAATAAPLYGLLRAIYDGFAMSFLTQLDVDSATRLEKLMVRHLLGGTTSLQNLMREPPRPASGDYVLFDHFWVAVGSEAVAASAEDDGKGGAFISTPTVASHLRNLARAVLLRKHPILLQGPTSSGKTSLVAYLAAQTGHKFVRINNHEQTDLQEYLGTYISDDHGRLVFKEGLLVQAMRQGHWLVLDELNLAPTEVLEALNRLLDDNRELYVPELQEVVKPHPHFMLFATQNPPGIYAGRKTLSKAFRSRFLELHVDDIPDSELQIILEKRCLIAPSYAAKLVSVMRELQRRRATSNVFAGRHGFITPRDLFRWAGRGAIGYQQLAEDGFAVLGERLRTDAERVLVRQVLDKLLNAKIDVEALYGNAGEEPIQQLHQPISKDKSSGNLSAALQGIVWTKPMRRMYWLLDRCLTNSEPALLVGETGTGKTTVCQLAAFVRGQRLHIINCNQHTEVSDFIGGYRPNRQREHAVEVVLSSLTAFNKGLDAAGQPKVWEGKPVATATIGALTAAAKDAIRNAQVSETQKAEIVNAYDLLLQATATLRAPFEWADGLLVEAMKNGDMLLIDELNLAEDAVLERLNSVLEPSRTLTLAEKGGDGNEVVVVAHPNFRVVATMNPGGDFGKKELSPALSNRFTSIWVPAVEDLDELGAIVRSRLYPDFQEVAGKMLDFWVFFQTNIAGSARQVLSVRDLVSWIRFINSTAGEIGQYASYVHGAHLVFLDGIGLGVGLSEESSIALRDACQSFLTGQLPGDTSAVAVLPACAPQLTNGDKWGIAPFYIESLVSQNDAHFSFEAPTTSRNAMRILRALQLSKPVLLEGSPGVGKTSLIAAMAKAAGREFVRINLSDQTDMMDLLGADLPVEGGAAGEFHWSDGPLLHAIKSGAWVLLDELNLANQTVLEGLNAVLDHRAEVFIPELNATFQCPPTFRLFGAQNPLQEGGGRKGLPRSFLNRFSRVHVELLQGADLLFITGCLHPSIPTTTLEKMVTFCQRLHHDANISHRFASDGGPWEFNLRDILRWCELAETGASMRSHPDESSPQMLDSAVQHYVKMLFIRRLRTSRDRQHVFSVFGSIWEEASVGAAPSVALTEESVCFTWAQLPRAACLPSTPRTLALLPSQQAVLESVAESVARQWMSILVGPMASGKTNIVRTLAALCGQSLLELSLTASTDTSDLLGGFEQVEPARKLLELASCLDSLLADTMQAASKDSQMCAAVTSLASTWLRRDVKHDSSSESVLQLAANVLQNLKLVTESLTNTGLAATVDECLSQVQMIATIGSAAGKFEWVDGALTRAIEQGQWVLLDNANLCNPSVLDRLNSLLEPRGLLYLNECGTRSSGPRMITPHPNFRLFLATDPRHGEVSRAMRNRGIELFLLPESSDTGNTEAHTGEMQGLPAGGDQCREMETILGLEGMPGTSLPQGMAAVQLKMVENATLRHRRPPSLRELKRWVRLAVQLCSRGWDSWLALRTAFHHIYVRPEIDTDTKTAADRAFIDTFNMFMLPSNEIAPLYRPGLWPFPLSVSNMTEDALTARSLRDIAPLLYWLGHVSASLQSDMNLDSNSLSGKNALVAVALLSGRQLGALLLEPSGSQAAVNLLPDAQSVQACVVSAAHAFSQRGSNDATVAEAYNYWALGVLEHCGSFVRQHGTGSALRLAALCEDASSLIVKSLQHPFLQNSNLQDLHSAVVCSLEAAVVLHRTSIVLNGGALPATLLEVSCWRSERPKDRARVKVSHPVIEWLWPLVKAVQELEEMLLQHASTAMDTPTELLRQVGAMQQWRWALLQAIQLDLGRANPDAFASTIEGLAFIWLRFRACLSAVTTSIGDAFGFESSNEELNKVQTLQQVAAQVDGSLGLSAGAPPKPLLWKHGGRPTLPKSMDLAVAAASLYALCTVTRVGDTGFCVDRYGQAAGFAAAGIQLQVLQHSPEVDDMLDAQEADMLDAQEADHRAASAEAATAAVAADIPLRTALLEGVSLFHAAALLAGPEADLEIPQLLIQKVQQAGDAAGEQALQIAKLSEQGAPLPEIDVRAACTPAADGTLPKTMPPALMCHPVSQQLQLSLLSLQDLRVGALQLELLGAGGLLAFQVQGSPAPVEALLEEAVAAVVHSGCRDLREAVPYQLLLWMQHASQLGDPRHAELIQGLVHEAWFRWQCGLHRGLASRLPPAHASIMGPEGKKRWEFLSGPMRLHSSTLTAVASDVVVDQSACIRDRAPKHLQLILATRQLRELAARSDLGSGQRFQAEWQALACLLVGTVTVYLPVEVEECRRLKTALHSCLKDDISQTQQQVGQLLPLITQAVEASHHPILMQLAEPALLPACQMLIQAASSDDGAQGLALLGRAWALLGLVRFHLLVPPAGSDPAAKHSLLRQHLFRIMDLVIKPELAVREQLNALPTGPDEGPRMAALHSQISDLQQQAVDLDGRSPPRPTPSQYLALREDAVRFAQGVATVSKVVQIVESLGAGDPSALSQAKVLQENALAWAEKLPQMYPAYRDMYQPLEMAAHELSHGLALATGAAELVPAEQQVLDCVARRLLAYPQAAAGAPAMQLHLASTIAQDVVSHATGHAVMDRLSTVMSDDANRIKAADAAALMSRVKLLRCALHCAAQQAALNADKTAALEHLHSVCCSFLGLWERIKEEEAKREAEEAEMFKTKARTTEILSEEQEAELDYHVQFPDRFTVFADLATDEEAFDAEIAEEPVQPGPQEDAPLAALDSVKGFLLKEVLPELVRIHNAVFAQQKLQSEPEQEFLQRQELGLQLLRAVAFGMPASVDDASMAGHLMTTALYTVQLGKSATMGDEGINIQQACLSEAVLIQAPLDYVRQRLAELLAEWPEHPVLVQLDAIACRLLEMPLRTPIKTLLTGLELLLARAQVWEETAAKHVTMTPQLAQVAALATRWRRLELESWQGLLHRAAHRFASEAYNGWFHLYRIFFIGDADVIDVGSTVEQFVRASPIGEYVTRLDLLKAFACQLAAMVAGSPEDNAQTQRLGQLSALLHNVNSYYRQFIPQVEASINSGMSQLEKELKDFVKLAKWEDRGYYAMKNSAEKAQRQLHRLTRRAIDTLREPTSTILRAAAKDMGIADLPGAGEATVAANTTRIAAAIVALTEPNAPSAALAATSASVKTALESSVSANQLLLSGKYGSQLPRLVRTFQNVVFPAGGADIAGSVASASDELAGDAASRAVQLKEDVSKGAKARKKKALIDLFRALGDCGVSKGRSAVPAESRGIQAWFVQSKADVSSLLDSTTGAQEAAAAQVAWTKADTYYYSSMARVQKLLEAANQPHTDLSTPEVEITCRMSEHLMYLMQRGRSTLNSLAGSHARLQKLTALLASLSTHDGPAAAVPCQAGKMEKYKQRQKVLVELEILVSESLTLLQTTAEAEPVDQAAKPLREASILLGGLVSEIQQCSAAMTTASTAAIIDADVVILFTPAMEAALNHVNAALGAMHSRLASAPWQDVPSWRLVVSTFASAAEDINANGLMSDTALDSGLVEQLKQQVESLVSASLVWAQNVPSQGPKPDRAAGLEGEDIEEEIMPIPEAMKELERSLGLSRLQRLLQAGTDVLSTLAALAQHTDVDATAKELPAVPALLSMVQSAAASLGLRFLALHAGVSKLAYVVSSLFAGVVEEGFCMPEGTEDGEPEETDQVEEGTGLGEGDTRGAQDITDELVDQDQLLGAQQKGAEKPEDQPQDEQKEGEEQPKGAEMDDDFEGALEDIKPQDDDDQEQEGDDEGDEEDRLDQQMGDTGDAGEDVDERLWNDDDAEEKGKNKEEEAKADEDPLKVDDASQLDYAAGEDQPEQGDDGEQKKEKEAQQIDRPEKEPIPEEGEEDHEEVQYEDRPEDRGFVQPEAPDQELELPEDLNLDGEGEEGDDDEPGENEAEEQPVNMAPEETDMPDAFPEQDDQKQLGEDDGEGDSPMEDQPADGLEDHAQEGADPETAPAAGEAEGDMDEDQKEEEPEGGPSVPPDQEEGAMPESQVDVGTKGLPSAVPESAGKDGAAEEEEGPKTEPDSAAALDAALEPPSAAAGATAGAASGVQDDAAAARQSAAGTDQKEIDAQQKRQQAQMEANPFRNLGTAMERWKARLAMSGDAPEPEPEGGNDEQTPAENDVAGGEPDKMDVEPPEGGEFRFLGQNEGPQAGDTQALAPANADQATGLDLEEDEGAAGRADDAMQDDEEEDGNDGERMEMEEAGGAPREMLGGKSDWGAGAGEKAGVKGDDGAGDKDQVPPEGEEEEKEEEQEASEGQQQVDGESLVVSKLQAATLEDGQPTEGLQELLGTLSEERAAALREELDRRLKSASEGGLVSNEEEQRYGREVWTRCETLTSGLVGELAEQLRLILEPTLASKLAGDFRSGKRINMKRVISYVASHFRKDKIWMRRTQPDKRRYQVVVAVDDSRSMAETGCGPFALEALTLICRAMARLDVGQLGVVSFGGGGGAQPLHALDQPFTDSDGVRVMSQMRFDQDNTIDDRPMVDVITSLDHLLEQVQARAPSGYGSGTLHQLVLVVADGRFHEKEALKRAVREAASKPGVLYAFIVLDNPNNSILDMQTVSFVNGKPAFSKYMDTFPFPFYIVLRDIAALPRTLADLMRQWFELSR